MKLHQRIFSDGSVLEIHGWYSPHNWNWWAAMESVSDSIVPIYTGCDSCNERLYGTKHEHLEEVEPGTTFIPKQNRREIYKGRLKILNNVVTNLKISFYFILWN